jgi:hypothetical protein
LSQNQLCKIHNFEKESWNAISSEEIYQVKPFDSPIIITQKHNVKGQLISKCIFVDFNFIPKTNENTSHSSKNEFICSILEEFTAWQFAFEFNWPLAALSKKTNVYISIEFWKTGSNGIIQEFRWEF